MEIPTPNPACAPTLRLEEDETAAVVLDVAAVVVVALVVVAELAGDVEVGDREVVKVDFEVKVRDGDAMDDPKSC